ncbi:hypothetical protein [Desulforamulus aquiferis]|uniref:Uncharacterized protein n=1 Tax=Desulforamulus aquiferis TaxID=1397668 RepID=A0AAW7Z4L9_9FIRM|nr:hypothetical protein [Desulforamulus aquiferis]MDO7785627.1 hypothetical protein [Desulforamulus aquiferis]RYD02897.1 hypothetical protein N752_23090 [Desulforamulus aquiferis]
MNKILFDFPIYQDRIAVFLAIKYFLKNQTGASRDSMLELMTIFLSKYGIKRFLFDNFSIRLNQKSKLAYIYGLQKAESNFCPGCGTYIFKYDSPVRILSIEENINDRVTYGCACGEIFFRIELNK